VLFHPKISKTDTIYKIIELVILLVAKFNKYLLCIEYVAMNTMNVNDPWPLGADSQVDTTENKGVTIDGVKSVKGRSLRGESVCPGAGRTGRKCWVCRAGMSGEWGVCLHTKKW
jgi:hypothetical protein